MHGTRSADLFQESMDSTAFSGFGKIIPVLQALNISNVDPVWTLKQTKSKIFLDIVWKTPEISDSSVPAKTVTCDDPRQKPPVQQAVVRGVDDVKPAPSRPLNRSDVCGKNKRKKKSPSTRKRDQKRFKQWKARKNFVKNPLTPPIKTDNAQIPLVKLPGVLDRPEASDTTVSSTVITDQKQSDSAYGPIQAGTTEIDDQKLHFASGSTHATTTTTVDTVEVDDCDDDQKLGLASGPLTALSKPDLQNNCTENICFNLQCLRQESYVHGGLKKCSRCSIAMYCSRECQAEHWRIHRTACGKALYS